MSPRIAISSLVVTLVLGIITFFALAPRSPDTPAAAADAVATLDSTAITQITVTPPDAASPLATITRDPALNLWLLRDATRTWPAADPQVRGFLRLIAQLARQPIDPSQTAPARATVITLASASGQPLTLHIAPTPVGGRVAVYEPASRVTRLAEAGLATIFTADALAAWRAPQPFATLAGQPSRIVVDASGRRLELARLQDRWMVQAPLLAPAERTRVEALAQNISRLTAARLLDTPPASAAMGFDAPAAVVRVITTVPAASPNQPARTLEQELTLGAASDATGATFFASLVTKEADTTLWGPQVLTLPRDAMSSLVAEGTSYIALRASQVSAPDVASLLLSRCDTCFTGPAPQPLAQPASRDITLARRDTSWTIAKADAPAQPASAAHTAFTLAALRQLCETPADKVLTAPPAGSVSIATITLRSLAGAPLDVVVVGEVPSAGTDAQGKAIPGVLIRSGPVYRLFMNDEARQALKALADLVPVEG